MQLSYPAKQPEDDLLADHSEGPGVSGHPVKAHPGRVQQKQGPPAGGRDKGNQTNPKSTKGISKKARKANTNDCKQEECPEALRLAKVVENG